MGPQVLKLSARRSSGAHPYLTTPEHTAQARELIGPEAFIAPEHKVVLTTDANGTVTSVVYQGNTTLPESEIASGVTLTAQTVGENNSGSGPRGLIADSRDLHSEMLHVLTSPDTE